VDYDWIIRLASGISFAGGVLKFGFTSSAGGIATGICPNIMMYGGGD
jgi:hypothetical protein